MTAPATRTAQSSVLAVAVARVLTAVLIAVGGLIHLQLWQDGYRGIPYIGPLFLANVVASAIVAARLLLGGGRPTAIVGIMIASDPSPVWLSVAPLGSSASSSPPGLFPPPAPSQPSSAPS